MTASNEDDRPTIAELEVYGLSLRLVNLLEEQFGFLYIDQLHDVTEKRLRTPPQTKTGKSYGFGPASLQELRDALWNFTEGRRVFGVG
jgi:hypothetical protein